MSTITWLATFPDTCGEPKRLDFLQVWDNSRKNIHKITDGPEERNPIKGGTAADAKGSSGLEESKGPWSGCKERPMTADTHEGNPLLK